MKEPTKKTADRPDRRSLEHIRAEAALKRVQKWKDTTLLKEASQRVKELPLMARNNGLGQTLAVLMKESRKRDESKVLLEALTVWLSEETPLRAYSNAISQPEDLLKACCEGGRVQYQLVQQDAIAFLSWLKLFSEAITEE